MSSGVAAQLVLTNVFRLRDGRIVNVELYRDCDEALKAAGLQESVMSEENVEKGRQPH